jgi:hypothetical protein
MKWHSLLLAGFAAGLVILAGELLLNLAVLSDDVAGLLQRFALPQPTAVDMLQAVARLLLLGVFAVWLAMTLDRALQGTHRAGIVSGLCIWMLAWAWVQWALLNTGLVTPRIAAVSVTWGLVEVPLAAWTGMMAYTRLSRRTGPS